MTPKKKAKEIIKGFLPEIAKFTGGQESHSEEFARRLAIITVDEIRALDVWLWPHNAELSLLFWEDVKKEIQKL